MTTINHEYYVSLEIAKLLKEAGFDWECERPYNFLDSTCQIAGPTLDMAQRWLREVKGIEVNVLCVYIDDDKKYSYTTFRWKYNHELIEEGFDTYEEAQEAGIKKVLEIILEKGE